MITSYGVHIRRRSQVEIDPPEGSPKVDFRMVLVLRSEELAGTAYIGVQPAHGAVEDRYTSRSQLRTWSGGAPPILPLFLVPQFYQAKG